MQLSSKVPLELFQTLRLDSHAMSSLHHQEPPRDLARANTSVLASQVEEPMLTLLASTSTRVMFHFTSRGTYVDLACIPDLAHKPRNQCWPCLPTSCPLHLTLN